MNKHIFYCLNIIICFSLLFSFTGCQIINVIQATPLPLSTETPSIRLEQLLEIPTLHVIEPTKTPHPESMIRYEPMMDVLKKIEPEIFPSDLLQTVRFIGTVDEINLSEETINQTVFSITLDNGSSVSVLSDDFTIFIDKENNLISSEKVTTGKRVGIFGVTEINDIHKVIADAIIIDEIRTTGVMEKADLETTLPYPISYTEYKLENEPKLNPLKLNPIEGDLSEKIKNREKLSLSSRANHTYGLYGEMYSTSLNYNTELNRDPEHPTRANMNINSNFYSFYDFWFPYVNSPIESNWGVITYAGDWYITVRMTVDINPDPGVTDLIYGYRTIMSEYNYDQKMDYLRSFGYSILANQFFYFYEKENGFGFSLNKVDYDLNFDSIPFGYADVYAELNPFFSDDLISFFGKRDDTWFYVEIQTVE